MQGSTDNLKSIMRAATPMDRQDGMKAYRVYNSVIRAFAEHYGVTFERALSAFVALSPNSDYFGNLRSLASVLQGIKDGTPCRDITVSTFKHCRDRAYQYATGEVMFLSRAKGPKVRAFFLNIFDPSDPHTVTVDGHMVAAWCGREMTMQEAAIRPPTYNAIAGAVRRIAAKNDMLANQVQATIWMTRKRLFRIKFAAQLNFFTDSIMVTPDEALPYKPVKEGTNGTVSHHPRG